MRKKVKEVEKTTFCIREDIKVPVDVDNIPKDYGFVILLAIIPSLQDTNSAMIHVIDKHGSISAQYSERKPNTIFYINCYKKMRVTFAI